MASSKRSLRRFALVAMAASSLLPLTAAWSVVTVARAARPHELPSIDGGLAHDVAIVPGSSVFRGKPNPHLARRLEKALQLYEKGLVRRVLVSGNERDGEVSAMSSWLLDHGVLEADILRDPDGVRTLETMKNAVGRFGIASAVICTQGLFLDRAVFLAREAGMDAVGVGAQEGRIRPAAPFVEAAKTALAYFEVHALNRLEHQFPAPVAVVAQVR